MYVVNTLYAGRLEDAYNYFKQINSVSGQAYCKLLNGDLDTAKVLLYLVKESSSFVNWLICLISIIEDKEIKVPTYFEIRNFYEQDLELLFVYKRFEFINKILNKNNYLENYNKEIYKYSARVLKNNNMKDLAEKYLIKSLDIFYNDPETHYMLGEIYEEQNNFEKAKTEYNKANEAVGDYLPAKNKLKKLN